MDDSKSDKSKILKIIKFIAIIGIILIPTIYTTVFLGSMWDPYGKLDKLPVAVVNLDKSCNYNNEELTVGDELVKNLKDDASLNFSFLDEKAAQEGLDNGTYYMVITIPENFSYNATTLLEDNPQKMELQYKINPGKNYIASKMSESAIEKITNSIQNSVTEVYAKAVFDEFSEIGVQLSDAADGASQITEGLTSLKEGSDTISSNLKVLYDSSLTFKDGVNTYEAGINKYLSAVEEIQNGSKALNTGISTLKDKTSTLAEGVDALNSGANSLYTGLKSYTFGVTSLKEGSKNLLEGLNTLSSSIGTSVNEENSKNIQTLTNSLDSLNKGINDINSAIQNSSSNDLTSAFTGLGTNLTNVGTSVQKSSTYINEIKTKIAEIKEADWFKTLDTATQNNIINGLSSPLTNLGTELNNIGVETSSASNNLTSAVNGVSNVSNQVDILKTSLGALSSNGNLVLGKSKDTITSLYSGLETVKTNLDNRIIPGASKIYEGANTLNSNSETIVNGAKSLSNGTATLNSSVPTLTEGIGQLANGSNTLTEGLNTLSQNNSSLKSGISTINSASTSISEGALKLYDGSLKVGDGASELKDGSKTLKEALEDGSETASSTKLSDEAQEMFAAPVENVEFFNSHVANNGSAMSAYMMCVGLWVGSLALCILFPTEKDLKNGKENPKTFWSKKVLKLASIAIIQAVVMLSAIILFNGLDPAYIGRTYLVAIAASISFMAIVYLMNILLGKVGSFILLVFMVLQLSGSAGTYPIELSDSFFKAIHNYMPFTYAVDGFRNGIATGLSVVPQITVLLGIGVVCSILSVIVIIKKNKSTKISLAELLEEAI